MGKAEVTGVTVSHKWDDNSRSDFHIKNGFFTETGAYVSITEDSGDTVYLRPESWLEVRDQIQAMFDSITADEDKEGL